MRTEQEAISTLFVDDDPDAVERAVRSIESENERISVEGATSVGSGLATLAEGDFECVVSGYKMPRPNGLELFDAVRENYSSILSILYTGAGSEEVVSEVPTAAVSEYVQKGGDPGQYTTLANTIVNAVDRADTASIDRVTTVVKDIYEHLVHANGQDDTEAGVCRILSQSERYQLAWIGDYDADERTVVPRTSAGDDVAPDPVSIDETTMAGEPTRQAVRQREVSTCRSVAADSDVEPLQGRDVQRRLRSCIAVPLVHDGILCGVLHIDSDRREGFGERERTLLGEVGEATARALDRSQNQRVKRRFEKAIEHVGQAVFITDPDGTINYVNPAFEEITGYSRSEAIGETPAILNGGEKDENYYERMWDRILAGETIEKEIVNRRKSGEQYTATETIAPITAEDGEVTAFVAVLMDISGRKEREAELRRQKEQLEEFATVVAHDLRNPLTVAQGRLDLIETECDTAGEHFEILGRAHERMEALIADMLTLARAGTVIEQTAWIDVNDVARDAWETVDSSDMTLKLRNDFQVEANRERIRQMFENLFGNVTDHAGEDITVSVGQIEPMPTATRKPDDQQRGIYVEDDGSGIAELDHMQIFDPGYTTSDDGTGYGLWIVKTIAEAHGWDINVTRSRNGGARFELLGVTLKR